MIGNGLCTVHQLSLKFKNLIKIGFSIRNLMFANYVQRVKIDTGYFLFKKGFNRIRY